MSHLTIDDIIYAYHEGVEVKICYRLPTRGDNAKDVRARKLKGHYDPDAPPKIKAYLPHIEGPEDFLETIYHEFAHAVDDKIDLGEDQSEEEIEAIALEICRLNPSLYQFIQELYSLPTLDELFPSK